MMHMSRRQMRICQESNRRYRDEEKHMWESYWLTTSFRPQEADFLLKAKRVREMMEELGTEEAPGPDLTVGSLLKIIINHY